MKALRFVPAHDVPLLVRPDFSDTVFRLRRYLVGGAAPFGYGSARALLPFALERTSPVEWLVNQVNLTHPTVGRAPNAQVIRALHRLGQERQFTTHDAPRWFYPVRADMTLPIHSDALVIEHGRPHLFWMQMRTSNMVPTPGQLGLLGRLFLLQAKRAGHSNVGLMIADMRCKDGDERVLSLLSLDDLPLASEDAADQAIQQIADAYDHLTAQGFDPKAERKVRRKEPPKDGPQASLF